MLNSDFLDSCPTGATTRKQLLKQCTDAQNNTHPLLKRNFRFVSRGTADDIEGENRTCIRVMQWNVLADGKFAYITFLRSVMMTFLCTKE